MQSKFLSWIFVFIAVAGMATAFRAELIENTPECLSCYQIYRVCNDNWFFSKALSKDNFAVNFYDTQLTKYDFNTEKSFLRGEKFFIQNTREAEVKEYTPGKETCIEVKNESQPLLCTQQYEEKYVRVNETFWEQIKPESLNLILKVNECVNLKVTGNIKSKDRVDVVLQVAGVEYKEWAWWNGTELNMTSGLINMWNLTTSDLLDYVSGNNFSTDAGGANVVSGKFPAGSSNRHFNAGTEYFKTADYDTPAVYSVSFWLNRSATSAATVNFAHFGDYAGNKDVLFFQHHNTTHIRICGYDTGYRCVYLPSVVNSWEHFVVTRNTKNISGYSNGAYVSIVDCATATGVAADENLIGSENSNVPAVSFDEIYLYNKEINITQIQYLYNNSYGNYYPFANETGGGTPANTTEVNVTFISQTPADLNTFNAVGVGLSAIYNASGDENSSSARLYHKINTSGGDVAYYINGSSFTGYNLNENRLIVSGDLYNTTVYDNGVYGGSYNLNETLFRTTSPSTYSLSGSNSYIKIEILNISAVKNYGILEAAYNASSAAAQPIETWYCNSTYTEGRVNVNSNCALIFTSAASVNFNHTDGYSRHNAVPFTFNATSGRIGGVGVTDRGYFLYRNLGNVISYNFYYLSTTSRVGATATSANNGIAWANQTFTVNAHLHQLALNEQFTYFFRILGNNGTEYNSTSRSDLYDSVPIPPSSVTIYNPIEGNYSGSIFINYSTATSPVNNTIKTYNLTLRNSDYALNYTMGNTSALNYTWNSSAYSGSFFIKVEAIDNASLSSTAYSPAIILDNSVPQYNNFTNNASGSKTGSSVNWNVTMTDNYALGSYIFSSNASGAWVNDTPVLMAGTSFFANVTKIVAVTQGKLACGRFYFNDTFNAKNDTGFGCFNVSDTAPVNYPFLNSSHLNITIPNLYCSANASDADNDTLQVYFNWFNWSSIIKSEVKNTSFSTCNQTLANESTCGFSAGTYGAQGGSVVNKAYCRDGNWETYCYYGSGAQALLPVYYEKSSTVKNMSIKIKINSSITTNTSILALPSNCFNNSYNSTHLFLQVENTVAGTDFNCYEAGGVNYTRVATYPNQYNLYEVAAIYEYYFSDYNNITSEFNNTQFVGGDNITCEVTAFDGVLNGTTANTSWLYVSPILNISYYEMLNGSALPAYELHINNTAGSVDYGAQTGSFLREWDAIAAGDLTLFAHQAAYKNASFNLIGTSRAYDYYFRAYAGQSLYSASVQANTTANLTVKLNLSVPPYQNGTYSYFFNASEGSSGTLCVGCLNYSGSINLSAYGNHTINVFSRSDYYEPQAYSFNSVQYFTNITLFFLDEKTNAAFNVSGTDGLMLYTICVDETIYEYNVKVANVTNVSNYLVICNFTKLKSVVSYPAASYYRSLIPNQSDKNVTFYLIDLYTDTAVAIALQFEGLDAFINPQIIIENANRIIIKDLPDMENKIVTYLLKNYEYQVIVQSASTYKVLGNLIADAAGTKFIRLNPVDVQMSYLQAFDYIFTAYNISETAIRANYVDLSAALSTVNLTIYNQTIWGAVLWSSEVAGTSAVNFTWNTPIDNKTSYVTLMTISHNTFGTLRQTQELQVGSGHYGSLIDITGDLPASVKGEVDTWKKIGVVMFLVVLALLFSAANAKLGVIITGIFALFFWRVGWLDITAGAITLIALTVVLNAITKKRT